MLDKNDLHKGFCGYLEVSSEFRENTGDIALDNRV